SDLLPHSRGWIRPGHSKIKGFSSRLFEIDLFIGYGNVAGFGPGDRTTFRTYLRTSATREDRPHRVSFLEHSRGLVAPRNLQLLGLLPPPHEQCPPLRKLLRGHTVSQTPFPTVTREKSRGDRHVVEGLHRRLEHRTARPTRTTSHDQVKTQVPSLGDEWHQRHQRVGVTRTEQVEVVDHDKDLLALPPTPVTELTWGDVGAGNAFLQLFGELGGDRLRVVRARAVGQGTPLFQEPQMCPPIVHQDDPHLLLRFLTQLTDDRPQESGLPGLRVTEDQQVRLLQGFEESGFQVPLTEPEDQIQPLGGSSLLDQVLVGDLWGQDPDLGNRTIGPAITDPLDQIPHPLA